MNQWICVLALVFATLSFGVYLFVTVKLIPATRNKASQALDNLAGPEKSLAGVSPKDIAEIVKALASLTDSLVKAGPALWSLIGSALFLIIASAAAGVFSYDPPSRSTSRTSNDTNGVDNQTLPAHENLNVGSR